MWKRWAIFLALLPTLSFAQLTPITNLHQVFGLGLRVGNTNIYDREGELKWDPVTKQVMYHDGEDWQFMGYLYDDSGSTASNFADFVAFTSSYFVADSTTNYTPFTTFSSATNSLWLSITNIYSTDFATNYARRTGDTFTGPVTSTAFFGGGRGLTTQNDITVLGDTFGAYTNNQVIPAGTSFQTIFTNMLRKLVNPTYDPPSFALSFPFPAAGNHEVGSVLTPQVNPSFTKNDAGVATNYVLTRNSVTIFTNTVPVNYTANTFTLGVETVTYQATVFYEDGPIYDDNFGDPFPTGAIQADDLSASGSFIGRRRYWIGYSTSSSALLTNSAEVKALSSNGSSGLITANNQTVTLAAPSGTRKVVLAYPLSEGALTYAKADQPNADSDVLQPFAASLVTNISVGGVSDFDPVVYRVYHWIPVEPSPSLINFTLRIP